MHLVFFFLSLHRSFRLFLPFQTETVQARGRNPKQIIKFLHVVRLRGYRSYVINIKEKPNGYGRSSYVFSTERKPNEWFYKTHFLRCTFTPPKPRTVSRRELEFFRRTLSYQ